MTRQLAFDLPPVAALGREDFHVSPANALALAAVDDWHRWPERRMLLAGPPGSGKTHLLQVWAAERGATLCDVTSLHGSHVDALAAEPALAIDDAEGVAGNAGREQALFHLLNLAAARGRHVLMACAAPPRDWGLTLPDLASRLQAAPLTRLPQPDDALLGAVLAKLFADRQIEVPPVLIPWLVTRLDRSLHAARAMVAALDAEALSQGRPVTRALAAEVLDRLPEPAS